MNLGLSFESARWAIEVPKTLPKSFRWEGKASRETW